MSVLASCHITTLYKAEVLLQFKKNGSVSTDMTFSRTWPKHNRNHDALYDIHLSFCLRNIIA